MTTVEQIAELQKQLDDVRSELLAMKIEQDRLKEIRQVVMDKDEGQSAPMSYRPAIPVCDHDRPGTEYESLQRNPNAGANKGDFEMNEFHDPTPDICLDPGDLVPLRRGGTKTSLWWSKNRKGKILFVPDGAALSSYLALTNNGGNWGLKARLATIVLPDNAVPIDTEWTTIFNLYDCNGTLIP